MRGPFSTLWLTSGVLTVLLTSCGQPVKAPTRPAVTRVFGIEQGQPLASLKQAHRIPIDVWGNQSLVDFVFDPPDPDPTFTQYAVFVTTKHGVCQIQAHNFGTKDPKTTPSRKLLDAVKKGLEAKYGPPSTSLERLYMWEKGPTSPSKLPEEINVVTLDYYPSDGGIALTLNFSNFKDCTKDIHLKWTSK